MKIRQLFRGMRACGLALCAVAMLTGVAHAGDVGGKLFAKPRVLVTIKPVQLMVEALAGDSVNIERLGAASANPHAIALSLKERQQVSEADAIIWLGERFERQLAPLMKQAKQPVLALGRAANVRFPAAAKDDLHIWLAPYNVSVMLEAIAAELSTLLPLEAALIQARLVEAQQALMAQEALIAERLAPFKAVGFIVNHDAYSHWVAAFGLRQIAAVSQLPEQQLGARQRFQLQKQAENAACLIVEPGDQGGERLAAALKLPIVAIDPLGRDLAITTLAQLFEHYAAGFEQCFKAGRR